jgi:hypothetical protein
MTSSLYLNVIVAYVQYMYVFVSYQYVDSSDMAKSDLLYESLSEIAQAYFNDLSDEGVDWIYYPIEL